MIRGAQIFFTLLGLLCLFQSCKKRDENRPRWETEILAPLVKTSLSIQDFLPDTTYKTNADNSLSIVYSAPLYTLGLDSLIDLQLPPFTTRQSVENLEIDSDTIEYSITLGELARQLIAEGESIGQDILDNHGNNYLVVRLNDKSINPLSLDFSDMLVSAKILSGSISVEVINGFPVGLEDISMSLSNKNLGDTIVSDNIASLGAGSAFGPVSYDLAGKIVEGAMNINISNFDLINGYPLIDTNATFTTRVVISDLKVDQALAVFPSQQLLDMEDDTPLEGMGEVRLTKARLKTGKLTLSAISTAKEDINYLFNVPVATRNGTPFAISGTIPAASNTGTPGRLDLEYDFSGYEIDLTGSNRDTFNVIHNVIRASIGQSSTPVLISRTDYVEVTLAFEEVKPSYVEGFLGKDTIDIGPGEVDFDLFEDFNADEVDFKELKLSMDFINGVGAEGDLEIESLTASNAISTVSIDNVASGTIPAATSNPFIQGKASINANGSSPGPEELLNLQPQKIGYAGKIYLNRSVSDYSLSGFAYDTSSIAAYVNMELPMNLATKNFTLKDTLDFSASIIEEPVGDGTLSLLAWNGYPFDAGLVLAFLDAEGNEIDRLVTGREILAGTIDQNTGKVSEKKYSKVDFPMDLQRLNQIMLAEQVVIESMFWTMPEDQHVKIYSDYLLDIKLVGDFEYSIVTK